MNAGEAPREVARPFAELGLDDDTRADFLAGNARRVFPALDQV